MTTRDELVADVQHAERALAEFDEAHTVRCLSNLRNDPWCPCGRCCDERAGVEYGIWP